MEYIVIIGILMVLMFCYLKIAKHFNISDTPNLRSSHKNVTLTGGGIIFYIGYVLFAMFFNWEYPYFFIGLTLVSIVSFIDDIRPVIRMLRLLVHFIAVAFMFTQLKMYDVSWYTLLFFSIIYVGFINVYNFMDGINGLTAGYSLAALGSFYYVNNYIRLFIDNELLYTISFALLVFLFFNFRKKAICFAGDVGAVSIAFILLFLLVKLILKTADFSYFIIFAVYGVDGILTILHRLYLRENIFQAHRKHLYQILVNEVKMSHLQVACIYIAVQLGIFIGYIFCRQYAYVYFSVAVLGLSALYGILIYLLSKRGVVVFIRN